MLNQTFSPDAYLDALFQLPRVAARHVGVTRDGTWIAWTRFGAGAAADVYAAPTDGALPPARLTDTLEDSLFVSWTPDGQAVIVAQDRSGNERFRLFRVELAKPGIMYPLTESAPEYFLRGGQLHPNGRWLVYGANYDAAAGQEIEPTWVYRHDLLTGERVPLAQPTRGCYHVPRLSPSGTHVLYSRNERHPSGLQVWLVDINGEHDREIFSAGDDLKAIASWFPDGRRALLRAETPSHYRIGVWELETESVRWILDDPERNIEDAYVPFGSEFAVINSVNDARVQPSLLHVETHEEIPITPSGGSLVPLAPAAPNEWIGRFYGAQHGTDLVRFSLADFRPETYTSLTRFWEGTAITPASLAPAEDFRWQSVDGLPIQGWLYRAQGQPRGTVVYVHGGPSAHSENALNPEIQYLVFQGFNVLDPNYRGSTGFSHAFRQAIKEDGWGGREQDDIRAGIEALIATGTAERGKIGITDTSYGGYSSWCAITRLPAHLLAAAAPVCGMTDLVLDYETTRPDLRPYSIEMLGGRPDEVPERYYERSPINFVSNIQGRLLIVQGLQDPNVSPENVRAVRAALDSAGIEYGVLAFDDEGHGIGKPHNQKLLYRQLAEFFASAFAGQ